MANSDNKKDYQSLEVLLAELEAVYKKEHKEEDFNKERPIFEKLIPELIKFLEPLDLIRPFAMGSTATVWEVKDERLKQKRALKLPRPRFGKIDKIIRVIRAESNILTELIHQNITKVYLFDEIEISINGEQYSFPFFLMDFLEGVEDIDVFINKNLNIFNADRIITYFRDVAVGLGYLHDKGIIHCDIKPGNIIIAIDSPALIADLGYAKHFERIRLDNQEKLTTVTFTPKYAHPNLIERLAKGSDSAASISIIKRRDLEPAFDLFAFGRTIQTVLQIVAEYEQSLATKRLIFTSFQWRYLALIAVRLLDGQLDNITDNALDTCIIPGLPNPSL